MNKEQTVKIARVYKGCPTVLNMCPVSLFTESKYQAQSGQNIMKK